MSETDVEVSKVGPQLVGRQLALVDDDVGRQAADVETGAAARDAVRRLLAQHKHLEAPKKKNTHTSTLTPREKNQRKSKPIGSSESVPAGRIESGVASFAVFGS